MDIINFNSLNAEIYIDFSDQKNELQKIIANVVNGTVENFGRVLSKILDINVDDNELFNSPKYGTPIPLDNDPKRYLYFRYRMDIAPLSNDIEKEKFDIEVNKILAELKRLGIKFH